LVQNVWDVCVGTRSYWYKMCGMSVLEHVHIGTKWVGCLMEHTEVA